VVACVDADVDTGPFHSPPRLVVALERHRGAGTEGEHVRPHRLELLVRHLDELEGALAKEFDEPHRQERQVDDCEVRVERREERHEMEDLGAAVVVREVDADHLDLGQELGERPDARVVRAVAASHEERPLVEPDRIAALRERWRSEPACDGNAGLDEVGRHGVGLAAPPFLPGTEEDRAPVGDDGRVVDVDGVGIRPVRRLREDDLGPRLRQEGAKGLVLGRHHGWIGLPPPAVGPPERRILRPGRAHEYPPQRREHALAAVPPRLPRGNLHRVETTARLVGLEAGGGCAAKYSAARLEELLAGFVPPASENLLVGLAPADDAAVYKLDDERALIFTTDFFPPMVDDPASFGAIAAANALNDVFAMGGRPLLALSIAAFPEEMAVETVRAVFDAAAAKVQEAGAVLAGGHTVRDAEAKYGLAVVGTVHPGALWRKSGARAGDALFLTKPLGTGLVLTGAARGLLGEDERGAALQSMTALNGPAAELLRAFEPGAVTDVTGFGLFGHALEMAERSGVRLRLDAASLPALSGALAAAAGGLRTGGDARNRDFAARAVSLDGVGEDIIALGYDPQTAGGLLVSLPAEKGAVLVARFRAEGLFLARIGHVEQGSGVAVS
jgi:selenide, water dikinase